MEDSGKSGKPEEKRGVVQFRENLMTGNFDEARKIEREEFLSINIVRSIVSSAFDSFIAERKFRTAITLATMYEMSKDKIADLIFMEFKAILSEGKFEEAIEWGLKYHLPDLEISRAAVKYIESAILKKNITLAVELKQKYSISQEQIGNLWQKGFNEAMDEEHFFEAALLSREFGMSERKTIITAAKAFRTFIKEDNIDGLPSIENEFRLFNDEAFNLLGDEDSRSFTMTFEDYLREKFSREKIEDVHKIVDGIGILYKEVIHLQLRNLVNFIYNHSSDSHGKFLSEGKFKEAQFLKNQLALMEDNVPDKIKREIYSQGHKFHNELLSNGELDQALKTLDEYQLLGRLSNVETIDSIQKAALDYLSQLIIQGELDKSDKVVEAYSLPGAEVAVVVNELIANLLRQERFKLTYEVMMKFKIDSDNPDLKESAESSFEKCLQSGYYETAADLGHLFGLKNPKVIQAAKTVWDEAMKKEEFNKARTIKKKHKLSKKLTRKTAEDVYRDCLDKNKLELAKKIRTEYNISLGFFNWLIELIKKILMWFGGGEAAIEISEEPKEEEVT